MLSGQSEKGIGLFVQKHNDVNYSIDRDGWGKQLRLYTEQTKVRSEPGDMLQRGIWTFEGGMSYVPYSQFSCSFGLSNVYRPEHLDRVSALTRHHGRSFLFTVVRDHHQLLEAALSRPEEFEPLMTLESWMTKHRYVTLFASKYEAHTSI